MAFTDSIGALGRADTLAASAASHHFSWCDHASASGHTSGEIALPAPHGLPVARGELLAAQLLFDENFSGGTPQLYLYGAGDSVELSPEAAEEFANDLVAFAVNLRVMARRAAEQRLPAA